MDTVRKSFLNEAAGFHICMWASEHKKKSKNYSIVHNGSDFTKEMLSKKMSNQVPNLPVFIDVRLINIKTVS